METKVISRFIRMGPRKVRLVLTAIKGKAAFEAMAHLRVLNTKGARITEKVLKSAIASATGKKMQEDRLYVKEVRADGGPIYKRIMTRSMGRADRIDKRTTHVTMVLGEKEVPVSGQNKIVPAGVEPQKKKFWSGKKQEAKATS